MNAALSARLQEMMRTLIGPARGTKNRGSALWHAAEVLQVNRATARALLYGETERVSDRRAEAILARESVALRDRLRQLEVETAALQARLTKLTETECRTECGALSRARSSGSLASSCSSARSATASAQGSLTCASDFFGAADGAAAWGVER